MKGLGWFWMGSRTKTDSTVGLNSPLDHTTLQTLRGITGRQRCDTDCVGHHQQEQHTTAIQGLEVIPCHLQQRNTQLSLKQINKQTKTPDTLLSPTTEEVPRLGTLSVGKFACNEMGSLRPTKAQVIQAQQKAGTNGKQCMWDQARAGTNKLHKPPAQILRLAPTPPRHSSRNLCAEVHDWSLITDCRRREKCDLGARWLHWECERKLKWKVNTAGVLITERRRWGATL